MARDLDVLDIASGEGYGSAYLAIVARSVLGVDLDPQAVRHAAARYTGMNLTFRPGSFARFPADDESFDLVVSFETLDTPDEREQFMREIVRVLRPSGSLIVSVPNKLLESDRNGVDDGFGVRAMFFDEFRDLLQNWFPHCRLYGQRVVAASAIHPLRGVAAQARCISPSAHGEQGLAALPVPASFLAVCSRAAQASPGELESVFVDPRDDLHERFASLRRVLAASPDGASAGGEAVQYLPADGDDRVASPALVSGDGPFVTDLLSAIFGHDDAVPPDRAEAVAQARKLVRDVFEERDRATVRLAELEAEVADQFGRLAEAEARGKGSAGELGALRAESESLRATIESLRWEAENKRLETVNATHAAERLMAQLEAAARQREALLAELERLRDHVDERAPAASAEPDRSALAVEVLRLRQSLDQFALGNGEGAGVARATDQLSVFAAPRPDENARLANALRERDEARVQLDRLRASRSWRITEPLRQLLRPFRNG